VYEIGLLSKGRLLQVLDNEKDTEAFKEERWYRGVILLPFPNRVRDGKYDFEGRESFLPINMPNEGHAIHGLMYNKSFSIIEAGEENTITLQYDYGGGDGYPFPCVVTYTFRLDEQKFTCKVEVKNKGVESLPLGIGWHPYFTLGTDVDELLLKMPKVESICVDERMIPTGEKDLFDDYEDASQIYDTEFDTGFQILDKGEVVVSLHNQRADVTLELFQTTGESGFNYIQVFTPPGRKSVAIEPMTCPTNAFNSKESLITLGQSETWSGIFGVRLR
jgi:aldose 1-epimerase